MPENTYPDWYLREWLSHFGKIQASLINELGWNKQKASFVFNGQTPYRRELVNQVAVWLGIQPFELLMPPDQALALRRLRETAYAIAAEAGAPPWQGPASDGDAPRQAGDRSKRSGPSSRPSAA